jgi:hypothetical protein
MINKSTPQNKHSTKPALKTIEEEATALQELLREYMMRSFALERRQLIVRGIAAKNRKSV